jgi:hypothetical protein
VGEAIRHTRVRSGIRLDPVGKFWHDGELVRHPGIVRAWHRGLERAPDGRYLVRFGHDWAYIQVDDAPFQVVRALQEEKGIRLRLSNEVEEFLQDRPLGLSEDGVLYCRVMGDHRARFSRQAQADVGHLLRQQDGQFVLAHAGRIWPITKDIGQPPPAPDLHHA